VIASDKSLYSGAEVRVVNEEQPLDERFEAAPRIILEGLDEAPPEFVNFMQVAYDAATFRVAFCRYLPQFPLRDDDLAAFYEAIKRDGWRVEVVSQLVVTPTVLNSMVEALQQHLAAHDAQWGSGTSEVPRNGERDDESDRS